MRACCVCVFICMYMNMFVSSCAGLALDGVQAVAAAARRLRVRMYYIVY